MTVAYLITSHTRPSQVLRLARVIRELSPAAPVVVHHDGRREPVDAVALAALGGVHLVPPEPVVEWGRGSQLDMLLRALRGALRLADFDWLSLVSGQDYPVRPLEAVERELARTPFDGFCEGHPVAPPPWTRDGGDEFARRYFYAWTKVPDPGSSGRRAVAAARPLLALREVPSGVLLGRRVARPPFTAARPCRRGSDWLTLRRSAVELVDRAAREEPRLLAHFRRTVLPTEAFPHTVLHGHGLRLSGDVRRHTAWEPGSPHPRVLRLADLDELLASGTDFARKFDERVDGEVLEALDRALGVRNRSVR